MNNREQIEIFMNILLEASKIMDVNSDASEIYKKAAKGLSNLSLQPSKKCEEAKTSIEKKDTAEKIKKAEKSEKTEKLGKLDSLTKCSNVIQMPKIHETKDNALKSPESTQAELLLIGDDSYAETKNNIYENDKIISDDDIIMTPLKSAAAQSEEIIIVNLDNNDVVKEKADNGLNAGGADLNNYLEATSIAEAIEDTETKNQDEELFDINEIDPCDYPTEMNAEDLLYIIGSIILKNNESGQVEQLKIIASPLCKKNNGDIKSLICISNSKNDKRFTTITSDEVPFAYRTGNVELYIRTFFEDGQYAIDMWLDKKDASKLNISKEIKLNGSKGHLMQSDKGIHVHIIPLFSPEQKNGKVKYVYATIKTENKKTTTKSGFYQDTTTHSPTFKHNNKTYRIGVAYKDGVLSSSVFQVN